MATAIFLAHDSSWRTVSIPWGSDYNERVSAIAASPMPPIEIPLQVPDLSDARRANDNGLRSLDRRQANREGYLPGHVCARAFESWARAETELKSRYFRLLDLQHEPDRRLEINAVFAWLQILKFNLASLSFVDESTPSMMLMMVGGQMSEIQDALAQVRDLEHEVERDIGLSSPTKLVRNAVVYALRQS